MFIWALTPEPHPIWPGQDFTSLCLRPGQHGRSSQNPQQHSKDWSQSPRQPRSSGSGSSWQRRTAVSTFPRADTGHWLVQLTQRGAYISWPCFLPSQPHSQRRGWTRWHGKTTGQTGRLGRGSAEAGWRCPQWFIDSITRRCGRAATAHEIQPPTDACLGHMQTAQHGQAQTQATEATLDMEHGMGDGLG